MLGVLAALVEPQLQIAARHPQPLVRLHCETLRSDETEGIKKFSINRILSLPEATSGSSLLQEKSIAEF